MKGVVFFVCVLLSMTLKSQTTANVVASVNLDSLVKTVREFSGEDSSLVYGSRVLIRNRVSNSGNDIAANYIAERLSTIGLNAEIDHYASKGKNVYAKQIGVLYPDSIVMICSHYDAVADYCADDNASGVAIVLEAARILSGYTFEKTIVYAFWDEEEVGLLGAKHYALSSFNAGDDYASVLNLDMAAYDANNDQVFDIDLNTNAGSVRMKNKIISINSEQNLNLTPMVVSPGTEASDHSAFWDYGYPGVLLGESWETNDQNSKYHSSLDRISLFNLPYYHEIAKLSIAFVFEDAVRLNSVYANEVDAFFGKIWMAQNNRLHLNLKRPVKIRLLNSNGSQVKSWSISEGEETKELNGLGTGYYFLQIEGERSRSAQNTVFVK